MEEEPNEEEPLATESARYQAVESLGINSLSRESHQHDDSADDFEIVEVNRGVEEALKQCRKLLTPYYLVAKILGWSHLSVNRRACLCRWSLIIFWSVVITFTFLTQILCCFTREKFNLGVWVNTTNNDEKREITCIDHLLSTFILFDLLVLATYWSGVFISFFEEKEYMYKLAEKVCTTVQEYDMSMKDENAGARNRRLIKLMWIINVAGLFWIIMSLVIRIMSALTLQLFDSQTIIRWNSITFSGNIKVVLVVLTLVGFITYDVVYFMATMNYAVQSEILCNLLYIVRQQLQQKKKTVDKTIEEFKDIQEKMNALNGKTATPTAIVIFILISNGVFAVITLDDIHGINRQFGGDFNVYLAIATAVLNIFFWMGPVFFVITQAARVSYQGKMLKETGLTIRIQSFLYKETDRGDLDSYLALTQATRLKATMLGAPIYAVLLLFVFIILIFLQTGNYTLPLYLSREYTFLQ